MNSLDDREGAEGDQLLRSAFERQVERNQQLHGLSEEHATRRALADQKHISAPGDVGYEKYVANLKSFIQVNNDHKKATLEKDDHLKADYPKSYMLGKVNRLMDQKDGLSEFEAHSGFSEVVYSRPVTKKERHAMSR